MPWLAWTSPARSICVNGWPAAWLPEIAAHLTMTHGLFPWAVLPDVWVSFLGSAWSLSAEWQFYLLAVLVPRRRLAWVLLALAVAGASWRLFGPAAWQFSRAFLPNQAHYFALGVVSVGAIRRRPVAIINYAGVLCVALAVAATTGGTAAGAVEKMLPPLAWSACLMMQLDPSSWLLRIGRQMLASPVCLWFGALSYCIYLVNEPVHKVIGWALASLAHGNAAVFTLLWVPGAIALPVLVSAMLHHWLEQPALAWVRRRTFHAESGEV
jgi:peptidoglycan/LPS O-acetylase OafA/YrhL